MGNVTGKKTLGPKRGTLSGNDPSVVTFGMTEFQTSIGYATIEGPFSLEIEVRIGSIGPLFATIQITTIDGQITVSDREHVAVIVDSPVIVISGNSVPALGRIEGVVTSIQLSFEHTSAIVLAENAPVVTLRLDYARPIVGAQPYIGRDLRAITRSAGFLYNLINLNFAAFVGNHATAIRQQYTVPDGTYAELEFIWIQMIPSAVVAFNTAQIWIEVNNLLHMQAIVAAGQLEAYKQFDGNILLFAGDLLEIATANNSGVNIRYEGGFILKEYQ